MSQRIQIRRSTASATPGVSSLLPGELAYSEASDRLFIGQPAGDAAGASVVSIGGGFLISVVNTVISGGGGIWDASSGVFNASQVASAVSNVTAPSDLLDTLTQLGSAIDTAANITGSNFVEKAGDIMTGSLRMSGSAFLLAEEGSATLPGFAFDADRDTGMYLNSDGTLGFAAGSGSVLNASSTAVEIKAAQLFVQDGTVAAPGVAFEADPNTGMYLNADGTLAFSAGGASVINASSTAIEFKVQLLAQSGGSGAPGVAFEADPDSGMFFLTTNTLGFAAGASILFRIALGSAVTAQVPYHGNDGTVALPQFAFRNSTDTGMYLNSAGTLAFAAGGASVLNASTGAVEVKAAQLLHGDGSAATPAVAFESEATTGIYQPAAGHWGVAITGTNVMTVSAAGVSLSSQFSGPAQSASDPTYAFNADGDSGMFLASVGQLAFAASGVLVASMRAGGGGGVSMSSAFAAPDGSATNPTYTFTSDADSGMYLLSDGTVALATAAGDRLTASAAAVEIKSTQLLIQDGVVATPGLAFESDPDTGVYLGAAGRMGLAAAGSTIVNVTDSALSAVQPSVDLGANLGASTLRYNVVFASRIQFTTLDGSVAATSIAFPLIADPAGTAAAPAYSFTADTNTGMFSTVTGRLSFAAAGSTILDITDSAISAVQPGVDLGANLGASSLRFNVVFASQIQVTAIEFGGTLLTVTGAELNQLSGLTASAAELNVLDGVIISTTELNFLDNVSASVQNQLDDKISKSAGGTFESGINITFAGGGEVLGLPALPTVADAAASKAYVDSISAGLDPKESVKLGTDAALPAVTAAGSGVGKTLTADAVGIVTVDGETLTAVNGFATGDRILVKDQAVTRDNGIFTITTLSASATALVLTRATDQDGTPSNEVSGGNFTFVEDNGTSNADTGWVVVNDGDIGVDDVGVAEISTVTTVADVASSLDSTFFLLDDVSTPYYVWMDIDNGGVDPAPDGRTGVEINITVNDTAATIAAVIASAVGALADFSASATAAVVTIDNATSGSVADVAEGTAATGFGFATTTQGVTDGAIVWTQCTGAGSFTAGDGLSQSGGTINVNFGPGIAAVAADAVSVDLRLPTTGAIILTEDGTSTSTASAAQLFLLINGSSATLEQDAAGLRIPNLGITNAQIASSTIENVKLANDSISFLGDAGGSATTDLGGQLNLVGVNGLSASVTGSTLSFTLTAGLANLSDVNNSSVGVAASGQVVTFAGGEFRVLAIDGGTF